MKKNHAIDTQEKDPEKVDNKKDINCNKCDQSFERNCDFEKNTEEHKLKKEFKCDICDKKFCHFYNNGKPCPYEAIGMFYHSKARTCKLSICNNDFCQFEHSKEAIEE